MHFVSLLSHTEVIPSTGENAYVVWKCTGSAVIKESEFKIYNSKLILNSEL